MAAGVHYATRLASLSAAMRTTQRRPGKVAIRSGDRQGRAAVFSRSSGDRGRALRAGLSLLAIDGEGSGGDSGVWRHAWVDDTHKPVRDDGDRLLQPGRRDAGQAADAGDGGRLCDGDDRNGHDGSRQPAESVQKVRTAAQANAGLPDVQDGYRVAVVEADSGIEPNGISTRFDLLRPAEQLNHLTYLTLRDFYSILAVPLHCRPVAEWPMWLRAKVRTGAYVLSARLRVDESSLRQRQLDALPKLLDQIEKAKKAHPSLDLVRSYIFALFCKTRV